MRLAYEVVSFIAHLALRAIVVGFAIVIAYGTWTNKPDADIDELMLTAIYLGTLGILFDSRGGE